MKKHLNREHLASVKKSYLNLLALFLSEEKLDSRFLRCLLKWAIQLNLSTDDLKLANVDLSSLRYLDPNDRADRLEAVYHLVYMIYLDEVVEDVELEVASIYAQKLGFRQTVVSDLFKSIATAVHDGSKGRDVQMEVHDFLKLYEI